MDAFKTIVFSFAALGAAGLAAPAAAATTVLSYVGDDFTHRFGLEPIGERITATLELADPLGANFTGRVSWLAFTFSDGVHTISAPYTFGSARFATDADGEIINWQILAGVVTDDLLINLATINTLPGQFGGNGSVIDFAEHRAGLDSANANVSGNPGVWTVTTRHDPGVVPEPAAWSLMIAGFGLTGAALRKTANNRTALRRMS